MGDPPGFKINAIGFNIEDDLIYDIVKSNGTDALGPAVKPDNIVVMDVEGKAYFIGKSPHHDFVGDFDDSGNLWTFNSSLNRVTQIDIDALDVNGNPTIKIFDLPNDLFKGSMFDIAFNSEEQAFYSIATPGKNGGDGRVVKLDISDISDGGAPSIETFAISQTLVDGVAKAGMPAGAFGAVFLDGEGNLYGGLNRGDHDLGGQTGASGAVYRFKMDPDTGEAAGELMSKSQSTGSNDGTADPRSIDPFTDTGGGGDGCHLGPTTDAAFGRERQATRRVG